MNKTIVTAVAAFVLGSVTTGVLLAQAQPAGPAGGPPPAADDQDSGRGPWMGQGRGMGPGRWMGPGRGMGGAMEWGRAGGMGPGGSAMAGWMHERQARRMETMRTFALITRADDLKLTPPDVQKIAEAFLLRHGNHTWKVINVKPDGDLIAFDLATAEGSVIAHFAMDPKTGRPIRRG